MTPTPLSPAVPAGLFLKMGYENRKVTVMGLGHFGGGVEAARWLARNGARVTVTDLAGRPTLAESIEALRGEPIARFHLGGHPKRS